MRYILLIITLYSYSIALSVGDFPLWGSQWTFVEGENEKILYPSAFPFRASKVARITFPNYNDLQSDSRKIQVDYWNLMSREYRTSSEVLDELLSNANKGRVFINKDEINPDSPELIEHGLIISYEVFADTFWACGPGVGKVDLTKGYYHYYNESSKKPLDSTTTIATYATKFDEFTYEKPSCYAKRRYNRSQDEPIFKFCGGDGVDKICFKSTSTEAEFQDYCQSGFCYEGFDPGYEVEAVNYWQVHLFTELIFNCRNPSSGQPEPERPGCIMDFEKAKAKKAESLANPDNYDMRYFRNPILDKENSVYFSFSFLDIGETMRKEKELILTNEGSGSPIEFSHIPNKFFRYDQTKSHKDWIEQTIIPTYAKDHTQETFLHQFGSKCGSWKTRDRANAAVFFPKKEIDPSTGEKLWVRDEEIDFGDYDYGGCPVKKNSKIKMTLPQARNLFFQHFPQCETADMIKAYNFLKEAFELLGGPDQTKFRKKLKRSYELLMARLNDSNITSDMAERESTFCPETWVDFLPE